MTQMENMLLVDDIRELIWWLAEGTEDQRGVAKHLVDILIKNKIQEERYVGL